MHLQNSLNHFHRSVKKTEAKMIKEFYSIKELLELDCPKLPKYKPWLLAKAKRENWLSRPRKGKGGGLEYSINSLPSEAKDFILSTQTGSSQDIISCENKQLELNLPIKIDELKSYQREVIDARTLILAEVDNLAKIAGQINSAIEKLIQLIKSNQIRRIFKSFYIKKIKTSYSMPVSRIGTCKTATELLISNIDLNNL